jgi:hypothetical protein
MRDLISTAMHRRWCLGLGLVSLLGPLRASALQVQFRFRLPGGFKAPPDVTAVEGIVPAELLEEGRGQDAFGVMMDRGEVIATFGATEVAGPPRFPVSLEDVRTIIDATPALRGATAISCSRRVISATACIRFEIGRNRLGGEWRQLVYLIPWKDCWASVHMAARQADYERLAQEFDAWVASRSGLIEAQRSPPAPGPSPDEEGPDMITLGACLGVTALAVRWLWLWNRNRRRAGED